MYHFFTKLAPPSPVVVPWSLSWRLKAPDFDDDGLKEGLTSSVLPRPAPPLDSSLAAVKAPSPPAHFHSLGEYASACLLGPQPRLPTLHVPWHENSNTFDLPPSQPTMAFRLVDPAPFMPPGAQRMMVHGRPMMRRVVTGQVQEQNNNWPLQTFCRPHKSQLIS